MGVVGPNQNLLFCEGKPSSLDYLVLQRLRGPDFTLQPAGSKNGLFNFVDGFTTDKPISGRLFAFRDRDFDAEPTESIQLLKDKPSGKLQIFMTHRTCIENYLLEPSLIHKYWSESAEGPRWSHGRPPTITAINQWIDDAARTIADYQAIRWSLNKLRPGSRWPTVRNTWTGGSGNLPSALDIDACMASAIKLVKEFRCSVLPVNHKALTRYVEDYRQRFSHPQFWNSSAYLVWFHGKDLKKAMNRAQNRWISLEPFFEWAAQKLDWHLHPDLVELNQLLNAPAESQRS